MHSTAPSRSHSGLRYGPDSAQAGDLYLPGRARPPVVCLLHGGFWRMPYDREQLTEVAQDLASRGYAVWNIGYRRLGAVGGEWPASLSDVVLAVDHLATLVEQGFALDLDRVVIAGHSAGGQLALCAAARSEAVGVRVPRIPIAAVAGLAPVCDLAGTYRIGAGNDAVGALLGGAPEQFPQRYRAASPIERLPLGIPQLIVHGDQDPRLPLSLSAGYAAAARSAGDRVEFVELAGAGHMVFLDPCSQAHATLCEWLARVSPAEPSVTTKPTRSDT